MGVPIIVFISSKGFSFSFCSLPFQLIKGFFCSTPWTPISWSLFYFLCSGKSLSKPIFRCVLHTHFSRIFRVLGVKLRSLNHLELIFIQGKRERSCFNLSTFIKMLYYFPLHILDMFIKSKVVRGTWTYICSLNSIPSIPLICHLSFFFICYDAVFTTIYYASIV